MEIHPRIKKDSDIITYKKIILGSFPIWSLSEDAESYNINIEKKNVKSLNGDFDFFFGSSRNLFWKWYKKNVDTEINVSEKHDIQKSLEREKIGITDIIYSCKRKGKSALDKHLTQRVYNRHFFVYPKTGETLKILCTSKGVMNEMLLTKTFFIEHDLIEEITFDTSQKLAFLLKEMDSSDEFIRTPIFRSLKVKSGGNIECLAIPSPGSPYRRLIDFGLKPTNCTQDFLEKYLTMAFKWFNT